MSCLCRGVCIGVSLARLASGWGDEYSVHKAPTPSLQVQRGIRVSVPLLHLTCMSSSPKRQNCTSLFSLQRNNLSLPLLSCYSPSSLSSFSFTLSTRQIPGTCRLPVARNLPFATYRLSATLITPTNFKKQKEILKSSQVTKQATQFTFAEPPCQNKDRKSSCLLGGLNLCFIKERNGAASFPHGSLEPSFPRECSTSMHRHAGRAACKQTFLCRVPQCSCLTQSSAFHLRSARCLRRWR